MDFLIPAKYYGLIEKTTKRLEIIDHLKDLFIEAKGNPEDAAKIALLTTGDIFLPWESITLGMAEKSTLKTIATLTRSPLKKATRLYNEKGDLGLIAEHLLLNPETKGIGDFFGATTQKKSNNVSVEEVYDALVSIGKTSGPGSINQKLKHFSTVFRYCSPLEARYFTRMAVGQMRLRASVMTVLDGLAEAFLLEGRKGRKILESAFNVHPDLGFLVRTLLSGGKRAVEQISAVPGIPIRLMAAQKLNSTEEIFNKLDGNLIVENKYDGARVQVHVDKSGEVSLFSRNLDNMTNQYPDVVQAVKTEIKSTDFIAEGEIVGIDPGTGRFRAFQELMQRRRKYDIEEMAAAFPVRVYFFDVLFNQAQVTFLLPLSERRRILEELVQEDQGQVCRLARSWPVNSWKDIEEAMIESIEEGCEGIMAKSLTEQYQAGIRGWNWIKYKKDYRKGLADSFDLAVVGAYPGRGKRSGTFGTYLMASYDDLRGIYQTVCKLGTGFSDDDLQELQKMVEPFMSEHKPLNVESDTKVPVWINPGVIFEIEAAEITVSPEHTCSRGDLSNPDAGLSLRFPRFIRAREDKDPENSNLSSEILQTFRKQFVKKTL